MEILKGPSDLCDFCNEALNADYTAYNTKDFVWKEVKGTKFVSAGAWRACRTCADLVDKEDWDGLHRRAVWYLIAANPGMSPAFVEDAITTLYEMFRRERV
jgi:hypothetical protein